MFDDRVERALVVALDAHASQVRKGSGAPYAVHPIHVALLLTRLGVAVEVVVAGILHDVVEDSEAWDLGRLEAEFGAVVAGLVAEVTEDKSQSWDERKRGQVADVPHLSSGALVIKACDKLHNLETLARSLRDASDPSRIWGRFQAGRERTIEMSTRLVEALQGRVPGALGGALRAALDDVRTG